MAILHQQRSSFLAAPCLRTGLLGGAAALLLMFGLLLPQRPAGAQLSGNPDGFPDPVIDSLKKLPVPAPAPAALAAIVRDKRAAIELGKALFWDTRVSSDNKTACASCHFSAGADTRIRNQLGPGLLGGDRSFQLGGPNYTLKAADFPLTRHANINDATSRIADINDVVSSQGVQTARLIATVANGSEDKCAAVSDAVFHGGTGFNVNGVNTRRVEPRNAPSVINAVFNFRNFWDGRASSTFNGVDPFGLRNEAALIWKVEQGLLRQTRLALPSSALASLSSGPPVSRDEMSCLGRSFANLGRKLVDTNFLQDQRIDAGDSILGQWAYRRTTYGALIRQAFRPEFWNAPQAILLADDENDAARSQDLPATRPGMGRSVAGGKFADGFPGKGGPFATPAPRGYAQIEANFALFFGLAVQLYQATLVADDTPFDRYMDGKADALTAPQQRGLQIFTSSTGNCFRCHSGPALSAASFANVMGNGRIGSRISADGTEFRFDTGFFNIGVRPTGDDPGIGGLDPFGNPLSETRMSQLGKTRLLGQGFDPQKEGTLTAETRIIVDGAFKVPGLRNVEFTGPYFHNGGKATLMQVVDFYNRGGDFVRENGPSNLPPIQPLGLSQDQKDDLVAFLLSLSDDRVRHARAPFDHPSLCITDGHEGDHRQVRVDRDGKAIDRIRCIDAVGAAGSLAPAGTFLGLSPFQR